MFPPNHTAGRRRVLLVDDDLALRRVLRRVLAKAGFEVVEAPNGKVAWELAQQSAFDLVVTDVDMPVMGGLELLRRLTTKQPELPVVLMSGSFDIFAAGSAAMLGACHFLRKPFLVSDLQRCALHAVSDWNRNNVRHAEIRPVDHTALGKHYA